MGKSKKLKSSKKRIISKKMDLSEGSIVKGNMGDELQVRDHKFVLKKEEVAS